VPTVFLQHTRVSGEGLVREQENPEVREGVGIANQCGSIVSSQRSTMSNSSYSHQSLNEPPSPQITAEITSSAILYPLQSPASFFVTHGISSSSSSSYRRFCSLREIHFPPVLLHNQGYPKVCPDTLNLPNAGDSFAGISSLSSCYLFSPDQGLNCFNLESSRVFFVKFPEPSLFQISELLHFIKIRKKFIKMQNQFCLNP
jgi:hypothetical protein